jgi:hypothetical protein
MDLAPLCDYLAFDVISDLCYGESLNMLASGRYRHFPRITKMLGRRNAVVSFALPTMTFLILLQLTLF